MVSISVKKSTLLLMLKNSCKHDSFYRSTCTSKVSVATGTELAVLFSKRNFKLRNGLVREQDGRLRLHTSRCNDRLAYLRAAVSLPSLPAATNKLGAKPVREDVNAGWAVGSSTSTFWFVHRVVHRLHHHRSVEGSNQI